MPKVILEAKMLYKYDWNTLLDGSVWECIKGEDFFDSPKRFASACYKAGEVRGLRVRTRFPDGSNGSRVIIQAYEGEKRAYRPRAEHAETA